MKLIIRAARSDDVPALADLWHEMAAFHARQGSYWRIKPNCKKGYRTLTQEVLKSKDKAVLIAHYGEKPVGFVLVQLSSRARIFVEKDYGLIVDLAVTKGYRRAVYGHEQAGDMKHLTLAESGMPGSAP